MSPKQSSNFKNILILGHSNIGDVCYDLIITHPIKQQFPEAKITYLTTPRAENIPRHWKSVDRVIVYDKSLNHPIFGRLPFMWELIKMKFDLVIVLKSSLMYHFLMIPMVWSLKQDMAGAKMSDQGKHVIDIYLSFLKTHGIKDQYVVFNLQFSSTNEQFVRQFMTDHHINPNHRLIGFSPLAAWSLKNWPVHKWNDLAQILQRKHGFKLIAFGKNMGNAFDQYVLKNLSPTIISAIDKTSLTDALALIKRCQFFIGPDSSLLHLASCMKVETIGVYGATSKDFIYPYFHRHNMVVSRADIPCMPCYPPGTTICEREQSSFCGQCMEEIDVQEVLAIIENKL